MTHRWAARLLPLAALGIVWALLSLAFGQELVPGPHRTVGTLGRLALSAESWRHLCLTVFRGAAGLVLATAAAYLLGIPCGMNRHIMDAIAPLVTAAQSCPPIVWISLLLVWVNVGTTVPVLVVFAAVFPMLFLNIAQGVAGLDRGLFAMARVYHVPRHRVLLELLLPGISRYALAAFSFALGVTWKVAATAEFFGAGDGVGARIFWAYRLLDMETLFAWTVVLILVGVSLETGIVNPLRRRVNTETSTGKEAAA